MSPRPKGVDRLCPSEIAPRLRKKSVRKTGYGQSATRLGVYEPSEHGDHASAGGEIHHTIFIHFTAHTLHVKYFNKSIVNYNLTF